MIRQVIIDSQVKLLAKKRAKPNKKITIFTCLEGTFEIT
jgi:hypothetical protein